MVAPTDDRNPPTGASAVVGIGASAGGLPALEEFLAHAVPGKGLAFVIVQHMDPTHKAMLSQLLQRVTPMPVAEVVEGMRIEADHVYVIPPNKQLTVADGSLHLAPPTHVRGQRLPVDGLFTSLAAEWGERAVAVVLSGMGADGKLGVEAVRAAGGLTLAQQPDSAGFDSMPRSAIDSGCVDIIALPADMGARIARTLAGRLARGAPDAGPAPANFGDEEEGLQAILALIKTRTHHDLALYKQSTLQRRIARRMALHGCATLASYHALLQGNVQELELLFKEMLIGVTGFFRDTAVWRYMQDEALPRLLRDGRDGRRLRAWVAGCSTGEEAYSLAIVFREVVDAMPEFAQCTLQIFATDLSKDAIERARSGRFAASILQEMSAERLARFFSAQDAGFVVAKTLRDTVVFAPHDLTSDPPFTKLDLLCCRNLLIYFTAPLQRRLPPLFHYSLRPGGVLLLGGSETVGRFDELFEPLDANLRFYLRRSGPVGAALPALPMPTVARTSTTLKESIVHDAPGSHASSLQSLAEHVLLSSFSPPAVLVNEQGDIVYINGRTGRYLEPAAGRANWNLHVMAREGIRTALGAALRQASQQAAAVELMRQPLEDGAGQRLVDITVQRLAEPKPLAGMLMVVFRDAGPLQTRRPRRRSANVVHQELEEELRRAREETQTLREEMRASQEELQASNEELQSTNEELQSTNEELTSSKEEMQSMNEELQAVNAELQAKLQDLELAQSDMRNLLNSTEIATLFLDRELKVRRFTEQACKIFTLREGDAGRPISDLACSLDYPDMLADIRKTVQTLKFSEKQIPAQDGRWYTVRVMPYRTQDDKVQGAVITFIDITASKQLEAKLRSV